MPRGPIQRIQDSVHGLMEFHDMETIVIDVLRTPEIQRLRRIHQLGLAHFVFPGAEHSRLVHSLGASFLAIRFARRLKEASQAYLIDFLTVTESAIRDFAVAALCHDLGHGPLSHAWEREVVGERFNLVEWATALGLADEVPLLEGMKWHELVGQALLAYEEGQLNQLLEAHQTGFSRRVRVMLQGKYYIPYLPRLLSSDIDVDRADFLRRDAHQTGVAYGRYDLDWLISTCTVGTTVDGRLVAGFDKKKASPVIEQFLIARRALYETVYYHKTVRSAEGMVALFLRRLKVVVHEMKEGEVAPFVRPLVKIISGGTLSPRELLSLDDYSLWVLIDNLVRLPRVDDTIRDLGQRILSRDLFKLVPCSSDRVSEFLSEADGYERIFTAIQPYSPGKREYYLVVDRVKFSMLSDSESSKAYLIDEDRHAEALRDHPRFRQHWTEPKEIVRLFTIREAVEAVRKVIV